MCVDDEIPRPMRLFKLSSNIYNENHEQNSKTNFQELKQFNKQLRFLKCDLHGVIICSYFSVFNHIYPKSLYPSSQTNVALALSRTSLAFTGTGGWPQLFSEKKKNSLFNIKQNRWRYIIQAGTMILQNVLLM